VGSFERIVFENADYIMVHCVCAKSIVDPFFYRSFLDMLNSSDPSTQKSDRRSFGATGDHLRTKTEMRMFTV